MRRILKSAISDGISAENLIQLIGEAEDTQSSDQFSPEENALFEKRGRLCQLLNEIEFTIESYGLTNFFIEYSDFIPNLEELSKLLSERGEHKAVQAIAKALDFYRANRSEFTYLEDYPADYDEKYEALTSKMNRLQMESNRPFYLPLSQCMERIADYIRKNPDEFFIIVAL